jgi:hypothetical protein
MGSTEVDRGGRNPFKVNSLPNPWPFTRFISYLLFH